MAHRIVITDAMMVDIITHAQVLVQNHGWWPARVDWNRQRDGRPGADAIARHVGMSWQDFGRSLGIPTFRDWQREALQNSISEAQRLAEELHDGRCGPSASEYGLYAKNKTKTYTYGSLLGKFGTWTKFLREAGLEMESASYYSAKRKKRQYEGTKEDVEDGIESREQVRQEMLSWPLSARLTRKEISIQPLENGLAQVRTRTVMELI